MSDDDRSSTPELVRVTFEFDMTRDDLRRFGGDDFQGRDQGITVESVAMTVVGRHDPALGYVTWRVSSSGDTTSHS